MSNIDERIVKMEFDNKAFEQHASETMSTLDKLKSALKFDKVKESFGKITEAAGKVDVSKVGDGVDAVNAKFSTMQVVGYSAINNITNSLMNFGKRVVGGTFGQIVQGGINRAFNIEQAKFTIEGLGKDFTQLQEDINYAVRGTAYGFDEAAKAASMMAASGIEAGDEMKASLRGISGMAAMTGDSYSNIADIFGNIAGKGKLSLQEVNRFATRGINVTAKLAEMMGETEEAVRDMVSEGEISFRQFSAAMDEAFGEHATEANRTFNGVMANIKASMSRIGESFVHPLIASNERDIMATQAYGKLNEQLIKVAQNAHTATESNVKARASITSIIKESDKFALHNSTMVGDLIKGNEKAYIDAAKKVYEIGDFSKEELHKMYLEDKKYVKKTLSENPEYAQKTSDELKKIFYTDQENFKAAAKDIPKYANASEKKLDSLYKKYNGFQYNLVSVMQGLKRVFDVIETAVKNSSALSVFLDLAEKASKTLSLFFNAIAASFSSVDKVVNGSMEHFDHAFEVTFGKGSKIVYASKLWDSFRKSLGLSVADFHNLRDTFKGLWSIVEFVGDAISSVFKVISSGTGIIKPILSIILAITGTLGRLISGILDSIRSFNIFGNAAKVIAGILGGIIKVVKAIVDAVVAAFTMITDNPVFDNIVHTLIIIGEGFNLLFNRIYDVGSAIVRFFIAPFRKAGVITEGTGHIITSILEFIADILWEFNKGLEATIKGLDEFVGKFIDFAGISRAGKKVADFFSKGFKFDGFLDGIFGIFSGQNAKKASSINPMKMFSGMMSGMKTLFDALTKFDFSKVAKSLQDGLLTVAGLLLTGFEKIGEFISKIDFSKIAKFLQDGLLTIAGLIIISAEKLKEGFDLLVDVVSSIDFVGVANSIGKALESFITLLVEILLTIPTMIGKVLSDLANNISKTINADKIGVAIGKALTAGIRFIFKVLPVILTIILRALQEVLANLPGILQEFGYALNKAFGDGLGSAFEKIKKTLSKIKLSDILMALDLVALLKFIKAAKSILGLMNGVLALPQALQDFLIGMKVALNKLLLAKTIQTYVITLGLIIGMFYLVSFVPFDRFINGLIKMTIAAGMLLLFIKGLNAALGSSLHVGTDGKGVAKVLAALTGFIAMLSIMMVAMALLSKVEHIEVGMLGFITILGGVLGFMFAVSKMKIRPASFKKISEAMVILSGAIILMSVGFGLLSTIDPAGLLTSVLAIGSIIAVFALASQNVGRNAKYLAAMGPMILSVAASLALLSLFDFGTLAVSALAITAVVAALVGASYLIQKAKLGPALASLSAAISAFGIAVLAVGAGVYLFVAALHTLSMMGQDGGIQALQLALLTLASMVPIIVQKLGEGLVLAAQAIGNSAQIIIDAILNIIERLLYSMLERAYMFATVGVQIILTLLDGLLSCMDKLVTAGVQICVKFLDGISGNMDSIVNSGILLGVSFVNGVANGLDSHSEEIWAAVRHLVGSIVNFILTGLQKVAEKIPGIGDSISGGIEKAKGAVEKFFGDGKVEKETKKGAKGVADAVDSETKKGADKANKNADKIPKGFNKAASKTKKSFKGVSKSVEGEFKEIPKMADISKEMGPKGKNSIEAWTKKFAEGAKEQTGSNAIDKVKKGADSVDFGSTGTHVFNGFSNSFNYSSWYNQGAKRAQAVNKGFRDTEKIKSPSKIWAQYGEYLYKGLANNMRQTTTKFYSVGKNAAEGVNKGFNTTASLLSTLNLDSLSEPTIRPVLDLSNVKMGLNSIDSMFSGNRYALGVAGSIATGGVRNVRASRPMTVNANLTVNNATDGKQFADDFMNELEIYERTYNG